MPTRVGALAGSAPTTLDGLLTRFPLAEPPTLAAGAAVSIVLREGSHGVETLLIERATNPRDAASGQVAFPGGRVAATDGSLLATALRELDEEVGLSAGDLDGPTRFVGTEYAARFSLRIAVFATRLAPSARAPTAHSPQEVADVFWLPRSALGTTDRVGRETGLGWAEVNATLYHGHVLWGFTRRVLREFFGLPAESELTRFPFVGSSGKR